MSAAAPLSSSPTWWSSNPRAASIPIRMLVHAAFEAFRAMGAASVRIAEGPGHRRNTLDLADAAGYFKIVPGFEDVFIDLNLDDVTRVRPPRQFSRLEKLYLPNTVLGADLLVSMPKMKTHHWVGATLSMKNLFGRGSERHLWMAQERAPLGRHRGMHRRSARGVSHASSRLWTASSAWKATAPSRASRRRAGVLVAGRDPVAVDATCCRIMRIDPMKIGYLQLAAGNGAQVMETNIRQTGESIAEVATPFDLIPEFQRVRLENS